MNLWENQDLIHNEKKRTNIANIFAGTSGISGFPLHNLQTSPQLPVRWLNLIILILQAHRSLIFRGV